MLRGCIVTAVGRLPRSVWDLLRRGDTAAQYARFGGGGDHAAHAALVQKLRYHGWTAKRIDRVLRDENNVGGVYYRSRLASPRDGRRAYQHYVERYVDRQDDLDEYQPVRRRDRSDVYAVTQTVMAVADVVIVGQTRSTDLAGIRVWAGFAVRHSTVEPFVSERDWAAGIGSPSRGTAQAVIKRLTERWRLLTKVKSGRVGEANAFRPHKSVAFGPKTPLPERGAEYGPRATDLADDCWRPSDLGRSARLVYEALDVDAQRLGALVTETRLAQSTVSRALRRLAGRGMARRVDGAWLLGDVDPVEASRRGACSGHGARDRRRFDGERCVYHAREAGGVVQVGDGRWVDRDGVVVDCPECLAA